MHNPSEEIIAVLILMKAKQCKKIVEDLVDAKLIEPTIRIGQHHQYW